MTPEEHGGYDIVALGEALIDMTPASLAGETVFRPAPGGAPLNLLAMAAAWGAKTAFIGKVGNDAFGLLIKAAMAKAGISARGLITSPHLNTTLAIVHLDEAGDRSFSFYRRGAADVSLSLAEVDQALIADCRLFHFGSLSLTQEPLRSATLRAVQLARGKIISYDPNYRPLLWDSEEEARQQMLRPLPQVHLLKVSEEECRLLSASEDIEEGAKALQAQGPSLVLVTLGSQGAYYLHSSGSGHVPTWSIQAVDTTGCGDAFLGTFLAQLLKLGKAIPDLTAQDLREMLILANSAGTLTALKNGGIPALPQKEAILAAAASLRAFPDPALARKA